MIFESRTCSYFWWNATTYFEDYIKNNQRIVGKNISIDEKVIHLIVNSLSYLLKIEILIESSEINDERTNSMMNDFITKQEKTIWIMQTWLGEEL